MHNIRKKKLKTKDKTKLVLHALISFFLYAIFMHLWICAQKPLPLLQDVA